MVIDQRMEDGLRATLASQAETIVKGPVWDAPESIGSPSSGGSDGGTAMRHLPATARRAELRPGRWRTPLLAAAAIAIVAVVTSAFVASAMRDSSTVSSATSTDVPTVTVGADGNITVAKGSPATTIDVFLDAICPACGDFVRAEGPAIEAEVNSGDLAVRYRMVDFLDEASNSGDYSSRVYAAMISLATHDGTEPDVFMSFYRQLFSTGIQPIERSGNDLSNADLARIAADVGASEAAQEAISEGVAIAQARTAAAANLKRLTEVSPHPGVPAVTVGDTYIDAHQAGWLEDLL